MTRAYISILGGQTSELQLNGVNSLLFTQLTPTLRPCGVNVR